jgi:hypothetical protein
LANLGVLGGSFLDLEKRKAAGMNPAARCAFGVNRRGVNGGSGGGR